MKRGGPIPECSWAHSLMMSNNQLIYKQQHSKYYYYTTSSTVTNVSVYSVVTMTTTLREFTQFIRWMQTQRQAATNPQTMPTDLDCESACRLPPSTAVQYCPRNNLTYNVCSKMINKIWWKIATRAAYRFVASKPICSWRINFPFNSIKIQIIVHVTVQKYRCSHTPVVVIYYYYSAQRLILIYRPTEGRRLSWPRWLATYWDGLPVPVPDTRVTTLIKIAKQCHTASEWHHLVWRVVRQLLCEVRCQHSGDWFLNGRIIGRCVVIAN